MSAKPKPKPKGKPGRKPYEPTKDQRSMVEAMAAFGVQQREIARVVGGGIALETLRKHFADELETGSTKMVTKVANRLFELAMAGNPTACIFILKCRAGWVDRQSIEHSGPGGGPIETVGRIERVIVDPAGKGNGSNAAA